MITSTPTTTTGGGSTALLERLGDLCTERGPGDVAARLDGLAALLGDEPANLEHALRSVGGGERLVEISARKLVELGGKRLRPLCTILAAKVGSGCSSSAIELAIAAELTHNATLLHDDVVDLADQRRGMPTARAEYGNAASIFAGDWLLIEALQRVRRADVDGALDSLLAVISEMILAESLQLERRGDVDATREHYMQVATGKSASLFSWALDFGGRAGGLGPAHCRSLFDYGRELGLAFQIVDDLLDLTGDPNATGKAVFTDLREGKMTFPLIVALERDPTIRPLLVEIAGDNPLHPSQQTIAEQQTKVRELSEMLRRSGAIDESRQVAQAHTERAIAQLASLPTRPATSALATIAHTLIGRVR